MAYLFVYGDVSIDPAPGAFAFFCESLCKSEQYSDGELVIIDDNGEVKSYDNDKINALAAELKEARDKALDGESMEQVAKEYEHVDFHEGSFYVDMQGVAGAFASAAKALEVGQTSEVIMDATASYVITRLEDNTLEDYEEYITILVNGEKERVLEEEFTTLSQDTSVRTNANVWKYMAVGKNKS